MTDPNPAEPTSAPSGHLHSLASMASADLTSWTQVLQHQRTTAQGIARLIADTLRAQFPQAAYLVLSIDYDRDLATDLFPHSIRDAHGQILTDFPTSQLPSLPEDSPLRSLWGNYSPTDAYQLRHILRTLRLSGAAFDDYPDELRTDRDDEGFLPCLLLSDHARPNQWAYDDDDEDYRERLLRPYSAPAPGGPARTPA